MFFPIPRQSQDNHGIRDRGNRVFASMRQHCQKFVLGRSASAMFLGVKGCGQESPLAFRNVRTRSLISLMCHRDRPADHFDVLPVGARCSAPSVFPRMTPRSETSCNATVPAIGITERPTP